MGFYKLCSRNTSDDPFFSFADPSGFILFPLVVHSFDLVVSSVGILSIKGTRESGAKVPMEDPMEILQKGYSVTIFLAILTFGAVMLPPQRKMLKYFKH